MTIEQIKKSGCLLYEAALGSQLYGVEGNAHEIYKFIGVYVAPKDLITGGHAISMGDFIMDAKSIRSPIREVIDGVEHIYYELRLFLKALKFCVPDAIDALFAHPNYGTQYNEAFEMLIEERKSFLGPDCKYTYGYQSLVELRARTPQRSVTEFTRVIPNLYNEVISPEEFAKRQTPALILDDLFLEHETGDFYKAYYSWVEYNRKKTGSYKPDPNHTPATGIQALNGKLVCSSLSTVERGARMIHPICIIHFDSHAYENYQKRLKTDPKPLDLALSYLRIKAASKIAETNDMPYPLKSTDTKLFEGFLQKGVTMSENSLELWAKDINDKWNVNKNFAEPITNEDLNSLELHLRNRFELLSTIATEKN